MDATPSTSRVSAELDELVFQALELAEKGGTSKVDELLEAHPGQAQAIRRRLETLRLAGLTGHEGPAVDFPERLGDFRLLEPLGGGGMGVVFRAEQVSLGREVALKLIRPEHLYYPVTKERFRREVEIVARLSHPGIVPIHTVGEEDGMPYFAMERIEGCTLADVLRALEGRDPAQLSGADLETVVVNFSGGGRLDERPELYAGSWLEACTRIVRDVAEALEHAHRAGVLHRDIKPSNVMVTPGGRVMLLDFGLASTADDERLTRTGTRVGSLPYVPPEQVNGGVEPTRRADVYALGVTLYELLTLELPFGGKSQAALLQAILVSHAEPVQKRNRAVSWEVATICEVALERDPARRYAAAGDMARDLTNVLERRPLFARRAGPLLRGQRWVQRHPTLFTALSFSVVALIVVPWLFASQRVEAAETLSEESERAAEMLAQESERAVIYLGKSLEAIERMMIRISSREMRENPFLEIQRMELLEEALELYEEIVGADVVVPLDSDVAWRFAQTRVDALLGLGGAYEGLGRYADAERTYQRLIANVDSMLAVSDSWALRRVLARTHFGCAKIARRRGDKAATLAGCELARAALAGAPEDVLDAGRARRTQANVELLACQAHMYAGEDAQALDLAARAIELARADARRTDLPPREARFAKVAEARMVNMLGVVHIEAGRHAEALPHCVEARDLVESVEHEAGADLDARLMLCMALNNVATCASAAGDRELALVSYERVRVMQERLFAGFPESPTRAIDLVVTLSMLGELLSQDEASRTEGREYVERGVEIARATLARKPEIREHRRLLGRSLYLLGAADTLVGDYATAHAAFEEGLGLLRGVLQEEPTNPLVLRQIKDAYRKWFHSCIYGARDYRAGLQVLRAAGEDVTGDFAFHHDIGAYLILCSVFAGADTALEADDRARRRAEVQDEAFAQLNLAVDCGWDDVERLDSTRVYDALRGRTTEYGALRARMLALSEEPD